MTLLSSSPCADDNTGKPLSQVRMMGAMQRARFCEPSKRLLSYATPISCAAGREVRLEHGASRLCRWLSSCCILTGRAACCAAVSTEF
jgi:hypothetical protein